MPEIYDDPNDVPGYGGGDDDDDGGSGYTPPQQPPQQDSPTGGGGSSGGGGGGGSSGPDPRVLANNRAFFVNTLKGWGFGINGNLNKLINNAVAKEWNSHRFLFYLRQTKEYRQRFTGIFAKNGSLKMSEDQYIATENRFKDYASKYGIALKPKMIDWMFTNNVSASEFADRGLSYQRLSRNKDLYAAFRRELVQSGIEKPGNVGRKNMLRFILGEGNKRWYDLWQDTVARNAAQQAGLAVGRKNAIDNLGQGLLERISGMGLSERDLTRGFEQLADDIAETLPLSELYGKGLTKADLVTLRFGGKGRNEIAQQVKEITAARNLDVQDYEGAEFVRGKRGAKLDLGGLGYEEGE